MAKAASNSGPVASRQGYRYQDHVAAGYVLEMIGDPHLLRVECETKDDIVIYRSINGENVPEFVQVKTTEKDSKWSFKEATDRDHIGRPTSLAEKSLLCAAQHRNAIFRIVSRRGIAKALLPLSLPRDDRQDDESLEALANKFRRKWNTLSASGLNLKYWALNALWEVAGEVSAILAENECDLARLADMHGANPVQQHVKSIYDDLLKWVAKAADASHTKSEKAKIITRDAALTWWTKHLAETNAAIARCSKPYRAATESFFLELYRIDETTLRRAMISYDTRYELQRWRTEQLADYLANWLPEMALRASELVEVRAQNLLQMLGRAIREISRHSQIDVATLLAETLLHVVLRHCFSSEPIACKLFFSSPKGTQSFGNAHIVHSEGGDRLWMGRSAIATASNYHEVVKSVTDSLRVILNPDFLKLEREIIVLLREPNHLLPTTLNSALAKNSPIDELLKVIAIPILIAYDSASLCDGFCEDYQDKLIAEAIAQYEHLKLALPSAVKTIHVHVFFLPAESVMKLTSAFDARIEGLRREIH